MPFDEDLIAEIRFLNLFNLASQQEGVKVHHDADPVLVAAAGRLYRKGITTQADGGYLTDLGVELAEHQQKALTILKSR